MDPSGRVVRRLLDVRLVRSSRSLIKADPAHRKLSGRDRESAQGRQSADTGTVLG